VLLKTPISERPADINDRSTYGHWESDSVVDRTHTGINVVVERKTRLAHITKLTNASSETTANALIQRLGQHPAAFVRSITYDNGPENARHLVVNSKLGCSSYFCEPYHAWEKGLVENTNEKIRRYIPKQTELATIGQDQLTAIEVALNNRPRKCLGYRTPSEAYRAWIASQPSPSEVKDNTVAVTH
jgi:transposase, IS30 family